MPPVFAAAHAHVYLVPAQVGIAVVAAVGSHHNVSFLVKNHCRNAVELAVVGSRDEGKALRGKDACIARWVPDRAHV